jgi:hypothetical protein
VLSALRLSGLFMRTIRTCPLRSVSTTDMGVSFVGAVPFRYRCCE